MTTAATDPPAVLVAGLGSAGARHLANLRRLGCRRLGALRARGGPGPHGVDLAGVQVHRDLREALRVGYDAVVVANPTSMHLDTALAAAEAGLDLYLEKPVSDRLEGTASLAKLVEGKELVAAVGCQLRQHPQLRAVAGWLREGAVGRVLRIDAEAGEYLPAWHPWEDYRASYAARRALGGGVLLTLIHEVDLLHWLAGPLRPVAARGGRSGALELDVEDHATALLEGAGSAAVTLHLDYLQRPPVRTFRILGARGTIAWDAYAGRCELVVDGRAAGSAPLPAGFERNDLFVAAMRDFLDRVADRGAPAVTLRDGLAALRVALELRQMLPSPEAPA